MQVVICVPGGHDAGVVVSGTGAEPRQVEVGESIYFDLDHGQELSVKPVEARRKLWHRLLRRKPASPVLSITQA